MRTVMAVGLSVAALCGCAGNGNDRYETMAADEASNAVESTRDAFSAAYDAVASGARSVAYAGEFVLTKAGDGLVRVTKRASSEAGEGVADAWITTRLKTEYGVDPVVDADQINVDTDDGVVTLRGAVSNAVEAQRAIELALGTPGVREVRSELRIPAIRNQAKGW
jgi:hyperosmotically inducible periplasmic protein